MSKEESRIVAHICGDGYLSLYKGKRSAAELLVHKRKNKYRNIFCIGYCNTETILLSQFRADVLSVYGLKTQLQKGNTVYLKTKWVFDRIKKLGGGDSRGWRVSKEINSAPKEVISEWLKAFFDDEAHVDLQRKRICVNSVNEPGLEQVQELLRKIGVMETKFYGPYYYKKCKFFRLTILTSGLKSYKENIGFYHPKKVHNLEFLLTNLSRKAC